MDYKKYRFDEIESLYRDISKIQKANIDSGVDKSELRKTNKSLDELAMYSFNSSKKLKKKSTIDGMTQVFNERGLYETVSNMFDQYQKQKNIRDTRKSDLPKEHILFYFDLDNLKYINDNFGHDEGDKYIMSFVNSIKKYFRGNDMIARVGGDEFVGLIENGIEDIAFNQRLKDIKDEMKSNKNYEVSYGFERINFNKIDSLNDFKGLIKHVDTLMYEQKRHKKSNSQ